MTTKAVIKPAHFNNGRWASVGCVNGLLCHGLPAHFHEEKCSHRIKKNNHKNRLHYSRRGVHANGLSAAAHFESFKAARSEERRVGKECRTRWATYHEKKNDGIS